jgi:hypothetical protein
MRTGATPERLEREIRPAARRPMRTPVFTVATEPLSSSRQHGRALQTANEACGTHQRSAGHWLSMGLPGSAAICSSAQW